MSAKYGVDIKNIKKTMTLQNAAIYKTMNNKID